ncbi:MAG: hypothetical protein ACI835_000335 [Planctomycetota bacterium]|jgi:hypothetical protein
MRVRGAAGAQAGYGAWAPDGLLAHWAETLAHSARIGERKSCSVGL